MVLKRSDISIDSYLEGTPRATLKRVMDWLNDELGESTKVVRSCEYPGRDVSLMMYNFGFRDALESLRDKVEDVWTTKKA